ncbi:MAG: alpha/beta hydrolase [Chthoniobacteraceae bacterium]
MKSSITHRHFSRTLLLTLSCLLGLTSLHAKSKHGKKGGGDDDKTSYIYKTVGKDELKLFVYTPKGHKADAKVPAIVFFHGGGFQGGSEKAFDPQSTYLAERGMVAICVRYRLTKEKGVEVTDCVEDAISAMRWVRANAAKLGIDPDRIAASGGSAGGYLSAATLLIDHINAKTDPAGVSAKPNALVLFNPGFGNREGDGADPRNADGKGNLVNNVKPGAPPAIIFHGKDDVTVPYATVEAFVAVMKKAGNRCELIGYEGEGHSFFHKGNGYKSTLAETDKFLTSLGWLAKKTDAK